MIWSSPSEDKGKSIIWDLQHRIRKQNLLQMIKTGQQSLIPGNGVMDSFPQQVRKWSSVVGSLRNNDLIKGNNTKQVAQNLLWQQGVIWQSAPILLCWGTSIRGNQSYWIKRAKKRQLVGLAVKWWARYLSRVALKAVACWGQSNL